MRRTNSRRTLRYKEDAVSGWSGRIGLEAATNRDMNTQMKSLIAVLPDANFEVKTQGTDSRDGASTALYSEFVSSILSLWVNFGG